MSIENKPNKDKSDYLWGMFQEHLIQGRHHESQRTNLGSLLVAVSAGILAFVANKDVTLDKMPLIIFLIFIGIFGALFAAKLTERARFHLDIAAKYRERLDDFIDTEEHNISNIRKAFNDSDTYQLKLFKKIHLYWFWIALYLLISVIGISLLITTLAK